MAKKSFSEQIAGWSKRVISSAEMVRKSSAIEVAALMQTPKSEGGNMPVDTGYLRASFVARTSSQPTIDPLRVPIPGHSYTYNAGAVNALISRATAKQNIFMGWQAAYAAYREYGTDKFGPDGFLRLGVQQWPYIVEKNTRRVQEEMKL